MKIKALKKVIKHVKIIDSSYVLSKIHKNITRKINLFVCNYEKSNSIAYISMISYFFIAFCILMYFLQLNEIWYLKLINLVLTLLVPILLIRSVIQFKYNLVIKDIPMVFEEFLYWLSRTEKINDTIKSTSENIQSEIKKPFQRLYYDIIDDPVEAFNTFKETFSNKYIDSFAELLKVYIVHGGDINNLSQQISFLTVNIKSDISFNNKIKERFLKFKIGSLVMIGCVVALEKNLLLILPDAGQTIIDTTPFTFAVIYFACLFFFINLFEKI